MLYQDRIGKGLFEKQMVERTRIELVTPSMSTRCSPAELTLHPPVFDTLKGINDIK